MKYALTENGPFHNLSQYLRSRLSNVGVPMSLVAAVARLSGADGPLEAAYVEYRTSDDGAEFRIVWVNEGTIGEVRGSSADDCWSGFTSLRDEPDDRLITGWVARLGQSECVEFAGSPRVGIDSWEQNVSVLAPVKVVVAGREVMVPEFDSSGFGRNELDDLDELIDRVLGSLRTVGGSA
ncbi:hypothetical protein nbrc107696_01420 [Gordonia spumicola]|uniref:Uncharacterized protein n=1 Tax=Gordonia spumicola TaxID=589161 RepID=A0A7I9V2R4_9ACTN|nr:hypothetical protein [Gordonia spumicola]GED99695.1 hypothetical protein nbrc107696_01420 [Gordonia spumicola]